MIHSSRVGTPDLFRMTLPRVVGHGVYIQCRIQTQKQRNHSLPTSVFGGYYSYNDEEECTLLNLSGLC